MKKIIAVLLLGIMMLSAVGCSSVEQQPGGNDVIIVVEGYGEISVRLTPENAPITVNNFKKLINEGAYDGTIFHRVINNFMIQGGDTTLTAYGEADNIKGEFSNNGVKNNLAHTRGVISMARVGGMNNSANSQFFICQKDCSWLDGDYAAFGYVTAGMEIVDAIANVPTSAWNDQPIEDIVITTIKFAE